MTYVPSLPWKEMCLWDRGDRKVSTKDNKSHSWDSPRGLSYLSSMGEIIYKNILLPTMLK